MGEEYSHIETKWYFTFDQSDFDDPVMFEKFKYSSVIQRQYKNEMYTWFKGSRTNTFSEDVKDKRKQKFIEMIEKYIVDNDKPIHLTYIPTKHLAK
jgi:hypothetical protein